MGQLHKPQQMVYNFGPKAAAAINGFLRRPERGQRKSSEIGFIFKDMTQKSDTRQMLKSHRLKLGHTGASMCWGVWEM